jgi:hypothetical protein
VLLVYVYRIDFYFFIALVARRTAAHTLFGLSASLTTICTYLGAMMGANNADIYG